MIAELWGAEPVVDDGAVSVTIEDPLARVFQKDGPALVGLARLLLDDPGHAEEVVQEAFIRTYAAWRRVRDQDNPLPYVRRTVVNLARGGLRRRLIEQRPRFERVVHAPSAELTAVQNARDLEVAVAVQALPRRQRECVVLRFYADCTVADIAATLRISDGAVKQHLHRALATLSDTLRDGDDD
jgi:RNA polymerase sigma-70 factor (sigma-E family)